MHRKNLWYLPFDTEDSRVINCCMSRWGLNIFIPRKGNVNAPVAYSVHVVYHDERSFDSLVRENGCGVLWKYLRCAIELETLNYFRDRRNRGNIWSYINIVLLRLQQNTQRLLKSHYRSRLGSRWNLGGFCELRHYSEIILRLFVFIFICAILVGLRKIALSLSASLSLSLSLSLLLSLSFPLSLSEERQLMLLTLFAIR